ncbi:TetR/AcrR family transcriptional regulator [Pyruvatibacter sp.]|uniref:TetR/AcrR family transcriptional regulator n=1 Tax=Pyruvatibacter sp. TaxID=1981328 RepID=UPI003265DF96
MALQTERREKTRTALLKHAKRLMLRHGYEATTTQMILEATGLSKGALYHHFTSKAEIAEAIYVETSRQSIAAASQSVGATRSHLETLRRASLAWLDQIKQPVTARILFELGPQALGWQQAKSIEEEYSLAAMMISLEAAQEAGETALNNPLVTARMLNALMAEAAFLHLEFGDSTRKEVERTLTSFLDALPRPK